MGGITGFAPLDRAFSYSLSTAAYFGTSHIIKKRSAMNEDTRR